MNDEHMKRVQMLFAEYETLLARRNEVAAPWNNGVFERYVHPVLTREHTPEDPLRSPACVEQRGELIDRNLRLMKGMGLR